MAKIFATPRILKEDVRESPPWFDRALSITNTFNQAVYNAITGQLTIGDNIAGFIREFEFTTLSNYSSGSWTEISFLNELRSKALSVQLMQIYRTDVGTYTPIKNGVYVDWVESNGSIIVGFVSGLEDSKSYKMRIVIT